MRGKRNNGGAAAIGGLTAAIVLVTGLAAARADEVSDLRAKQQLLQQQLDQLAPPPAQGSPPRSRATPDQPAADGGSFPRSFLIPGTSTSVRVGGFLDATVDRRISQ